MLYIRRVGTSKVYVERRRAWTTCAYLRAPSENGRDMLEEQHKNENQHCQMTLNKKDNQIMEEWVKSVEKMENVQSQLDQQKELDHKEKLKRRVDVENEVAKQEAEEV